MVFSKSLIKEVQDHIDGAGGPITRFKAIVKVFSEHDISYTLSNVRAVRVLCHPANRSTLGLNAHNAHRTGKRVHKVGADRNQLHGAYAFELPSSGPKRDEAITFNERLVNTSGGLLAPINGSERICSVGCGHFAAFVKASIHGCITNQVEIMDSDGRISLATLKKDAEMSSIVEVGWDWVVFPHGCELTWPKLPDLAQRALNASNEVGSDASENEVASCMAEFYENQEPPKNFDLCVEAAIAGSPKCAPYAEKIGTIVQKYGGGPGSPMIRKLDAFAKKFSENVILGEEFVTAIADTQILTTKPCTRTRFGLMAGNLTAHKVVDGIAQLHKKTDVEGLKRKPLIAEKLEAELAKCDVACEKAVKDGLLTAEEELSLSGRFYVRACASATGKSKHTFDKKEMNADQIRMAFITEFGQIIKAKSVQGDAIAYAWWEMETSAGALVEPKKAVPKGSTSAIDLKTSEDPAFIAASAGFHINDVVVEKHGGVKAGLYTIVSVGTNVELEQVTLGRTAPITAKFELQRFLKSFAIYKGDVPYVLPDASVDAKSIVLAPWLSEDVERAKLYIALLKLEKRTCHPSYKSKLQYQGKPTALFVKDRVPVGGLTFCPAVDMKYIFVHEKPNNPKVIVNGSVPMFICKPAQPDPKDSDKWHKSVHLNPFWWVQTVGTQANANMAAADEVVDGFTVKLLTNTKELKAWDQLTIYEKVVVPGKLHGAIAVGVKGVSAEEGAEADVAQPKKRGRPTSTSASSEPPKRGKP